MDYNSLKDIFAQQEGVFFYVQDNFRDFMVVLTLTFMTLIIFSILSYLICVSINSKLVLYAVTLFSIVMSIFSFFWILDSYNSSAKISEVRAAAIENIEIKLKMNNISELDLKISEDEVVIATAKYANMTERTTADLTIGFEDSGEPFILTSEFVTPEFIKTIEK